LKSLSIKITTLGGDHIASRRRSSVTNATTILFLQPFFKFQKNVSCDTRHHLSREDLRQTKSEVFLGRFCK
jgi:hypothetical protein